MPKTNFKLPSWSYPIIGVIFAITAYLFSIYSGKLNTDDIFMAVALIVLSSIMGAVVARITTEKEFKEKFKCLEQLADRFQKECQKVSNQPERCQKRIKLLDDVTKSAKEITHVALEKFGKSIVSYHDLIQIERSVKKEKEIWVLTSALELEKDELKEVIHKNLKNKIKYTYLIPKEDKILHNRMTELAKQWKDDCNLSEEEAQEQIKCLLVPKHFVYMTIIIYEPYEVPPTVLVKFPTSSIYKKEKYPLIYRVDDEPKEAWKTFLDSLQELIDDGRSCSQTELLSIDFSDGTQNLGKEGGK